MFDELISVNIMLLVLGFAFASVLIVNILAALVRLCLGVYARARKL